MADRVSQMGLSDLITGGKAPPSGDGWQDVPPVRAPSSDGWEDVPAAPAEPVAGTQGISDRLTRGIQPDQSWKLQDRQARLGEPSGTAEFAREGFHQIVDAITGTGPSQFDDLRPEVEKQLISIGRTPEVAKQEAERIGQGFKRQERMGGLLMGPLTLLTAPLLGAYRDFVSRPIEEATGFPKEATETFTMAGLAVAGLPAMSKQMARVKITPDGKVSAQAVGDLPKAEDFKTAAELLTEQKGANLSDALQKSQRTVMGESVIDPHAAEILGRSADLGKVEQALSNAGIFDLKPLGGGFSSVVLDADTKVVRLGRGELRHIPDIPEYVKPIAEQKIGGVSVEILPKVDMTGITAADVQQMKDTLAARGLKWGDAAEDNLGRGPDGKLYIIDGHVTRLDGSKIPSVVAPSLEASRPVSGGIVEQNLRTLWDERGIHPAEALHDAKSDAFLKHELTQPDRSVPEGAALEGTSYRLPIRDAAGTDVGGLKFDFQDIIDGPGIIKVTGAGLDEAAQGKGLGIRAYQQLADFALQNGRELWSDTSVSPEAARMYDALERRGYKVERIAAEDVTSIYDPAFKVTAGPSKEAAAPHPDRPLGEALRATDELRAANRSLPTQDRAILGELISAVRGAAAKRQLSVEGASVKNVDIPFLKVRVKDIPETGGQQAFILKPDGAIHDLGELKGGHLQAIGDMAKAEGVEVATSTEGGKYAEGQLGIDEYQRQRGLIGVTRYNNSLGFNIVESLTRQQLSAIREMVKKLGSEEVIFSVTDRNGQDKLYSKDINDLQKFVGANASVVMQGDRFKKGPVPDVPPAADAVAEHAWVEADQDLARAQAAMDRIEEVKARHPELAGTIDRAVQAVEDTLAQRDAMRPKSLGAAATDPPMTPLTEQPPPPAGALMASAQEGIRSLFDIGRDIQMKVAPMATGTRDNILAAKDFANTMRKNRWEWARIHDYLTKEFTPEQWKRMWDAADEESVLRQEGGASPHMGLATLEPAERAIVEGLHARAQNAWLRARDIGLVEGEGLPAYTPRMVINAAAAVAEQGALPLNSMGTNLKASTARLMKRKYLTAEETEAAAKAKYGEEAELARDIRTLPLATAQLEDAIAGRTLVNEIKRAGKAGGSETVAEGSVPAGSDQKWFTIDHPALKTWRPKFEEVDGKLQTVKDADGNVIFEQVPIYIRGDFEGPLRAVLDTKSGAAYQALMSLKGKTMSVIMYSPAIHNLVEFGRAFPAMPTRIFKAYFDGNRAKNDVAIMTEAIDSGLVPIGKRFFNQDIDAIMESPDLTPGRSWTAKVLAAVPGLFDEGAGTAVKRAVDKAGDFWHNTLLWDRIGDLQMGLYTNLRGDLIGKGVDPKTASITAAHWANRYAGALPQEAMSSAARKSANMLLFSRSFTMGNLGVMKDMVTGLPKDALAMIEREGGFKPGSLSSAEDIPQVGDFTKGMARRKALMVVALDIALMYVGNSVLQSTFNVMLGDKTIDEEAHGYTRRFKETLNDINTHPLSLLQPFSIAERLSATGDNEPGRRDRIRIGYQSDGTAIYARNPVGKIGEEFIGYMANPLEMLRKKEGTVARPLLQIFQNDKGFGRVIYDKNAETPMDKAAVIWAMVEHFAKAQTPEGQINALSDLVKGEGDPKTSTLQTLGPFAGVTFSKGAPGGPATGELYDYRQRHDVKVNMALPDIRKQILRGDVGGALQRMRELEIPPGLARFYIRTTLDPSTRVGGRTLRDFYMGATPEQRDRLERARQ